MNWLFLYVLFRPFRSLFNSTARNTHSLYVNKTGWHINGGVCGMWCLVFCLLGILI